MTTTAPPAYSGERQTSSAANGGDPFTKTKLATGRKKVTPFVSVKDLRDHLKLLKVFHTLRERVREGPGVHDVDNIPLAGDAAWDCFLARAVWRFALWVTKVLSSISQDDETPSDIFEHKFKGEEMPPLDVCLVWHTYSLNPRIYFEDGLRMHKNLQKRGAFPLNEIASRVDIVDGVPVPMVSMVQADYFAAATGHPFEYSTAMYEDDVFAINCPSCQASLPVRWWTSSGLGFSQKDFLTQCPSCRVGVKHEAFGLARLIDDISLVVTGGSNYQLGGAQLFGITGEARQPSPCKVPGGVKELPGWPNSLTRANVKEYYTRLINWNAKRAETCVRELLGVPLKDPPRRPSYGIKRTMKYYGPHYGSFSLDLCSAVKRQMGFVEKLVQLRPLEEETPQNNAVLQLCIKQYHSFLDLMAQEPRNFLVPTLGIDLAWHTHQLSHENYRLSTKRCVGVFVDHDDTVEQTKLAESLDQTAKLWQRRFHTPYAICGCPTTSSPSIVRQSIGSFFGSSSRTDPSSIPGYADYTHASEHDVVVMSDAPEPRPELSKPRRDGPSTNPNHKAAFTHTCSSFGTDDSRIFATTELNEPGKCLMGLNSGGTCTAGNVKTMYGKDPLERNPYAAYLVFEEDYGAAGSGQMRAVGQY